MTAWSSCTGRRRGLLVPTSAPSLSEDLVCSDNYRCRTDENEIYYFGCKRDDPDEDGTYDCEKASKFKEYSYCGPCASGDFDAMDCPDSAFTVCDDDDEFYYCLVEDNGDVDCGCHGYSDMTTSSYCETEIPTNAPSLSGDLVCSDDYRCRTDESDIYYFGCKRDDPEEAGTYDCEKASRFKEYSYCGPCAAGDFDAMDCPDSAFTACSKDDEFYYCLVEDEGEDEDCDCHDYSDMTIWSTCESTARRELAPEEDGADGSQSEEEGSTATTATAEIKHTFSFKVDVKPEPSMEGLGEYEDFFCSADDFPCEGDRMVYICMYSPYQGYQTLCISESKSDVLSYYENSYCGKCTGGLGALSNLQ